MNYEQARKLMKKEVVAHGDGSAPKSRHSLNRMNAIGGAVKDKQAQQELVKEFTSRRL